MGFVLTEADERKLVGVHHDLAAVIRRAATLTDIEFRVVEGMRTLKRQQLLLAAGATTTLNSRHLTGHAVDIVPLVAGRPEVAHWPYFHKLAPFVKRASKSLNVSVDWGGDWWRFKDGAHWELSWRHYPKGK